MLLKYKKQSLNTKGKGRNWYSRDGTEQVCFKWVSERPCVSHTSIFQLQFRAIRHIPQPPTPAWSRSLWSLTVFMLSTWGPEKWEEQLASILQWLYQNGQGQEEGERRGKESATINLVPTNTPSKVSVLILGFFPVLWATEEPLQAAMCNWQLRGVGGTYRRRAAGHQTPRPRSVTCGALFSQNSEPSGWNAALHSAHVLST